MFGIGMIVVVIVVLGGAVAYVLATSRRQDE